MTDLWRHKKTGGVYVEVGRGKWQNSGTPAGDLDDIVIYRSTAGSLWARPTVEFVGRFEPVETTTMPDVTPGINAETDSLIGRLLGRAAWYENAHPETVKTPSLLREAAAEIARLRGAEWQALRDLAEWCEHEGALLGAVDGYDYRSGEEHGLRRAAIQARATLPASPAQEPAGQEEKG